MKLNRIGTAVAMLAAVCAAQAPSTTLAATPAQGKVYIVQLAGAPAATYGGGVGGLAATRPAAGAHLRANTPAVVAYKSYLERRQAQVLARLGPSIRPLRNYTTAFNGFAAVLTADQAAELMRSADVVSVVESEVRQLDTTRTPDMLGVSAPGGVWSMLDANAHNIKGEDVIVAHLDTGIWPEDPNFGDKIGADGRPVAYFGDGTVVYGPPPAHWTGTCQTGPGFRAEMCNNKLIGARYYSADFLASGAVPAALEYLSPRDGDGHGSHTAATSSGNGNVPQLSGGVAIGLMSGVAPRARLAAYKVCWTATVSVQTGCYTADTLAAIDDAVSDGVDVINFSVSGTRNNYIDPVEIAYLNATAAGVIVVAAAGNDGPAANTVAHIGPWLTTAASSTTDRAAGGGDLTLGNAANYSGASTNFFGVASGNLVLSSTIAAAGVSEADANVCLANSLNPALAAGKVVVCDRGTNTAAARLAESAEVKRAGGAGAVLLNPDNAAVVYTDAHTLPTVQLALAARDPVRSYAATKGATGTIGLSYNRPGVIAPVVSSFSSRGPGLADNNVLKPDLMAPGSSIIAAYRPTLSVSQHDQVIAGTLIPPSAIGTVSGTSMATPHIAGGAALLRQLYPTWSPAAIKSALMTTTTPVVLSNGSPDPTRWNYGSGFLNPNGGAIPSLVYDTAIADYGRFICGQNLASPAGIGECAALGSIKPWNLNLPSLQAAGVVISRTLTRTVTNKSPATRTYVATPSLAGWDVVVTPPSLTLAPGASASFEAKLTRTTAPLGSWVFGSLAWSDGVVSTVSPLSAQALFFSSPVQVNDVRVSGSGSQVFTVQAAYTGSLAVSTIGLVPAIVNANHITAPQTQCFAFTVPAGTTFARFQTFQADTIAQDLDMDVFRSANCTGTNVGTSAGGTADEVVTLENPTAADYSVRVTGYATPTTGADYKLYTWIVGPGGTPTLKARGPSTVYAGGSASVAISWSVPAGTRYMGLVNFADGGGSAVGSTKVLVDNH